MAQLEHKKEAGYRFGMILRQRPGFVIALVLVIGLLVGAAAFGAVQASGADGIEIERSGQSGGEAADGNDASDGSDGVEVHDEDVLEPEGVIIVDVAGAVERPSVVQLHEGDRVQDAIDAADGLAQDADVSRVNRAAKLIDGQQVYIPHEGEDASVQTQGSASGGGSETAGASQIVNINMATAEELDALPGIGPSTAQSIIEDREANGPFSSPEDLMRVSGIGEKKYEKLKSSICV